MYASKHLYNIYLAYLFYKVICNNILYLLCINVSMKLQYSAIPPDKHLVFRLTEGKFVTGLSRRHSFALDDAARFMDVLIHS